MRHPSKTPCVTDGTTSVECFYVGSAEKGLHAARKTGLWRLSGGEIVRNHLFSVQPYVERWNVRTGDVIA